MPKEVLLCAGEGRKINNGPRQEAHRGRNRNIFAFRQRSFLYTESVLSNSIFPPGGYPALFAGIVEKFPRLETATIEYARNGRERKLRIASLADLSIQSTAGREGTGTILTHRPLRGSPGEPAMLPKAEPPEYADHGMSWEFPGKNGFFAHFSYQAESAPARRKP